MAKYSTFLLIAGLILLWNPAHSSAKGKVNTLDIAEKVLRKGLTDIDLGLYPGILLMHGMSELSLIHPEKQLLSEATAM